MSCGDCYAETGGNAGDPGICKTHDAECTVADAFDAQVIQESCLGQTIQYCGEDYEIPLAGVYQKENAVVALNALKVLNDLGFPDYC